jgi:hypothetical protein
MLVVIRHGEHFYHHLCNSANLCHRQKIQETLATQRSSHEPRVTNQKTHVDPVFLLIFRRAVLATKTLDIAVDG